MSSCLRLLPRCAVLLSLVCGLGCASEPVDGSSSPRPRTDETDEDGGGTAGGRDGESGLEDTPDLDANEPPPSCASIREDAKASPTPVDVVWIIDTSGSMFDELAQVQANIAGFMREFEQSQADTHAVMITGADPALGSALASNPRYRFVQARVPSRGLFDVALSTLASYRDFLRPDATTHFVMVTDDNDRMASDTFRTRMTEQLGHPFIQHAVASEDAGGRPCQNSCALGLLCGGAAAIGAAYNTLADQTMGEKISICSSDWTEVFGRLSDAVIASALPCTFAIPDLDGNSVDPELVSAVYTSPRGDERALPRASTKERCGTESAWHFDDEAKPTSIVLCPAACEQARKGGSIAIELGCEPPVVL